METRLDLKLDTLAFRPDPERHITLRAELCPECQGRPCTVACPAQLFVWVDGQMTFNCDGCLECGSCRVVCPRGAVTWRYPRGSYGVRFRWG
jgi:ferredoxin like protein